MNKSDLAEVLLTLEDALQKTVADIPHTPWRSADELLEATLTNLRKHLSQAVANIESSE